VSQRYVLCNGGWWPPGKGEGPEWDYEPTALSLVFDGTSLDISLAEKGKPQKVGLVSVPVSAIAQALAGGAS
jgi:hypothetical protein